MTTKHKHGVKQFNDAKSYMNTLIRMQVVNYQQYGLTIDVVGEAKDNSAGAIWIRK